jgi:peptide/nickel transport system permease protein
VIAYIIRRLGVSLAVLFGVSIGIFGLLHTIYPSPAVIVLGLRANRLAIAEWNKANGFDAPWLFQYWHWAWGILHLNFGWSYTSNQSVATLFANRWERSLYLVGMGLLLSLVIAIPLGIYQAVKRNGVGDQLASAAAFVLYAMPDNLWYLILIQSFALSLPIFGFEASQSLSLPTVIADWHDMTLPIVGQALLAVAGFSRYMRSSAIDTLAQDYIRACRAKGLPERLVLWRHLLRNACLPMVTLVGLSIPYLLAGNLICEVIFNYPGLGLLFDDALNSADYNTLLAYTMLGAMLTIAGNFIADLAMTVADPRIRYA